MTWSAKRKYTMLRRQAGRKWMAKKIRRVNPAPLTNLPLAQWKNRKPRLGANTIYRYSRYGNLFTVSATSGSEYDITNTFSLDQVKTYSDFTSLYDKFKITGVQVIISMISNPNATLAPAPVANTNVNGATQYVNQQNFYPRLWYVQDPDDAASISIDALKERQGVKFKVLKPNAPIKIFVKPSVLVQTYKTSVSTGYGPKRMWLDVATGLSVPHYALKMAIDNCGYAWQSTGPPQFRIEYKYYLAFKGVL